MAKAEAEQVQMNLRITAVIGSKAAGKDELAHYLADKYAVPTVEVGEFARKLAEESGENMPRIRYDAVAKSLSCYGSEYIICWLAAELLGNEKRWTRAVVITGLRTPAEAAVLKEYFGHNLLLAHVKVGDQKTRYDRLQNRDFETDPNDFETFVKQDERLKSNYALPETTALADITLWNNNSLAAYYQQIETYVVPHLFPKE